jgi:chemotaxis protein methyltransferase CheR
MVIKITTEEFKELRKLIYERFGIHLNDSKRNLVNGRLQKVLLTKGFRNFREYIDYLKKEKNSEAISELINKITTNHTYFFREEKHFDYFYQISLPEIVKSLENSNSKDLRIWCAGCATGEEAYSLVILMLEFFKDRYKDWNGGILATDISEKALNFAKQGIYPEEKLKKIPPALKKKYFIKVSEDKWKVSEQLKKEITFRRFNLMNQHFPFKKPFQTIFCRNVMIYFDNEVRQNLVERFYNSTEINGFFFIGHSESLGRRDSLYQYLSPAVYKRTR